MEWLFLILLICIGSHLFLHRGHGGNEHVSDYKGIDDHSAHGKSNISDKKRSGSCH